MGSVTGSILLAPAQYSRRKCGTCKKWFPCSSATRYKFVTKGDEKVYCSYTCFRVEDKRREQIRKEKQARADGAAQIRKRAQQKKIDPKAVLEKEEQELLRRIETAKYKIAMARLTFNQTKRGTEAHRNASKKGSSWGTVLRQALAELEEVRKQLRELEESAHDA